MSKELKNVLVTGGAGFIGSHVVDELIARGYRVRVLDHLGPPAHDGKLPEWFNQQAEFVQGDVRNKTIWEKALPGVDAVVHLAAYMDQHPDYSTFVQTNVGSLALLFELIEEQKLPIKKIVAASSQSVYGNGKYQCENHGVIYPPLRSTAQLERAEWEDRCTACGEILRPLPEQEDDRLLPQIPYGITKKASEELFLNLGRRYDIPSVITRVSIALGPRQSVKHFYSGALRAFAAYVLSDEPIKMNEDGQQTRDFVDVCDVARAYLAVLENPRADFQAFNFGSGQATRVFDLAKTVAGEAGVPFNPSLANRYRVGDARHSQMDVSKLKALGWEPQFSLQNSVREYLKWVRQFGSSLKDNLEKSYNQLKTQGTIHGY